MQAEEQHEHFMLKAVRAMLFMLWCDLTVDLAAAQGSRPKLSFKHIFLAPVGSTCEA